MLFPSFHIPYNSDNIDQTLATRNTRFTPPFSRGVGGDLMPSQKNLLISDYHLPYNPLLVPRAKELRKNMTGAERKLWFGFLRTLGIRVLRQRPIDNFIVDFYYPAARLVVEIDGGGHFTSDGLDYDWSRTEILEGYGLAVI